jgi:hypothetical protein
MAKSSEAPVEMKFFGFGAGQSTYYGKMESDKIDEFYKRELPARGWQPGRPCAAAAPCWSYQKCKNLDGRHRQTNDDTSLTLTVGKMGR